MVYDLLAVNILIVFELIFPLFSFSSPDGKFLVFLSAKSSVDSGAHSATDSLHRIDWPTNGKVPSSEKVVDVVRASLLFSISDCLSASLIGLFVSVQSLSSFACLCKL